MYPIVQAKAQGNPYTDINNSIFDSIFAWVTPHYALYNDITPFRWRGVGCRECRRRRARHTWAGLVKQRNWNCPGIQEDHPSLTGLAVWWPIGTWHRDVAPLSILPPSQKINRGRKTVAARTGPCRFVLISRYRCRVFYCPQNSCHGVSSITDAW